MGKKKCKTCGNLFEPKGANDRYCSSLCQAAGCFIGGGGDTTKPNSEIKETVKVERPKPIRTAGKDFPRVKAMLELPVCERWKVSRDFSDAERAYAKKLAKRILMEERVADCISDWDGGEHDDEIELIPESADKLGESDDGSV
jgi:hypothetical protein